MIELNLKTDTRQANWRRANPEKYLAHVAVQRALASGTLVKAPCEARQKRANGTPKAGHNEPDAVQHGTPKAGTIISTISPTPVSSALLASALVKRASGGAR